MPLEDYYLIFFSFATEFDGDHGDWGIEQNNKENNWNILVLRKC